MVKGAVFDLDGTLLDSMGVWREVDLRFLRARGLPIEEDYLRAMNGMNFTLGANYTIERYRLNDTPEQLIRAWDDLAKQAYATEVTLKPGTADYLAWLHASGIKMAVATYSYRSLFLPTLRRCGIEHYFSDYITKDECNAGKDTPEIYLRAARVIGCTADECLAFEDLPAGVRSCKNAGFTVIGVQDGCTDHAKAEIERVADLFIRDFTDPRIYRLLKEIQ